MRAVFLERPSLSRCKTTWDPDLVLNYMSLGANENLSTILLSKKLTILMLLVSGQRGQVLHLLNIRNMYISDSRVSFQIRDHLKTSRPGKHLSELLSFEVYTPDSLLCVHTTILHYLNRTKDVRGHITRLFVTTKPPIKIASRDTLRRWTKDFMSVAGINLSLFSPHSTRAASSSKAALKLALSTILSTVGWARESTFAKFYKKPLAKSGLFANDVLS